MERINTVLAGVQKCWTSQRGRYLLTAGMCLVLILARSHRRLEFAHLWAEDGPIFLGSQLSDGIWSVFQPYRGYFHVAGHLLSFLCVTIFGLASYPQITAICCLVITAMVFAVFTLERYRWIIRPDWARAGAAALLCLAPGTTEVFGNFANLHWILFFYAWLMAMSDSDHKQTLSQLLLLGIICFSAGEIVVVLPLFGLRVIQAWRKRTSGIGSLSREMAAVLMIVAAASINFAQRGSNPPGPPATLAQITDAILCTLTQHFVYLPWLGASGYLNLASQLTPTVVYAVGVGTLMAIATLMVSRRGPKGLHILAGIVCAFCVPLMTFIVRPESALWYGRYSVASAGDYSLRYYFVVAPFAVVLWAAGLGAMPRRSAAVGIGLLLAAYTYGALPLFHIPPLGREYSWRTDVRPLIHAYRTGCPEAAVVPIYPLGWSVEYKSKCGQVAPYQ